MEESALEGLTQCLDRQERQNRRLKRMGAVVAVGIAAVVLMGQARNSGKVVEAERFVVRDRGGRSRAVLGVVAGDVPFLRLYDQNGTDRAALTTAADGAPVLSLGYRDATARATLAVLADGTSALILYDKDGKPIWRAP